MREKLGSRLGFLMLAAGCAVGLGNVWRFPYVVGTNGGAAFVILYLACLALLGLPLLLAELAIGRGAQSGIAGAMAKLAPSRLSRFWGTLGTILFFGNFLLMIYYTDVAGWLVKYTADYAVGAAPADPGAAFKALTADRPTCALYMGIVVLVASLVCAGGVSKCVERVTKVMMIALFALLTVLAVRALLLPGAEKGLAFYLRPDWSYFAAHPVKVVMEAMGQAFFTLSIGVGAMAIFGSYVDRRRSLVTEAAWIVVIDTLVAFLAGLVVFPSCAANGVDYTAGPGLIFVALPAAFAKMPGGGVWGFGFFLFLSFAALTTVIAVFECLIGGVLDTGRGRRVAVALGVGVVVALASLPCVLWDGVLDWEDFAVSQLWLPIGALAMCLFVTHGSFGWGWRGFSEEASAGEGLKLPDAVRYHLTYAVPVLILAVMAFGFHQKFFAS